MKNYLLLFLLMSVFLATKAQGVDPGLPGGDPDVPLDGGVGLLLMAGAVYGVKKIRELKP